MPHDGNETSGAPMADLTAEDPAYSAAYIALFLCRVAAWGAERPGPVSIVLLPGREAMSADTAAQRLANLLKPTRIQADVKESILLIKSEPLAGAALDHYQIQLRMLKGGHGVVGWVLANSRGPEARAIVESEGRSLLATVGSLERLMIDFLVDVPLTFTRRASNEKEKALGIDWVIGAGLFRTVEPAEINALLSKLERHEE